MSCGLGESASQKEIVLTWWKGFEMVESRHRDLGLVAARSPEGEVDKFRGVLEELENITVEGGVVTRNKVQRLEMRIRHWEDRLRDLRRVCKRPMLVACFRQGLKELERVRIKIGGRCLEQPDDEFEGEGFWNRPRVNPDSDVELQEVVGRSVEVLGEEGAVGGFGRMGLRHGVKKSPVGSYSFEGMANMETSRQGRWRNWTQGGQVKEERGIR